ncbi:hypothetical protein BVX97_02155 [bacterium E08(2017)]|nr:hypothetical protein BVX97_02155 [bacterium E08(2017)]
MSRKGKFYFVTLLTFSRLPLVVAFFISAIYHAWKPGNGLFFFTFSLLILSALTDLFDGYFARKFEVVTKFGAHADPLMDKFFYLATLPLLVFVAMRNEHLCHGVILVTLTFLFLSRDQWVTFLRSIGSMYNVSGAANWAGKLRTAITFPLICVIYYFEAAPDKYQFLHRYFVYAFEVFALVINMISLTVYTKKYFPYLKKSAEL